jgi:hypothetical protein
MNLVLVGMEKSEGFAGLGRPKFPRASILPSEPPGSPKGGDQPALCLDMLSTTSDDSPYFYLHHFLFFIFNTLMIELYW